MNPGGSVKCPICEKPVSADAIEAHVNHCLDSSSGCAELHAETPIAPNVPPAKPPARLIEAVLVDVNTVPAPTTPKQPMMDNPYLYELLGLPAPLPSASLVPSPAAAPISAPVMVPSPAPVIPAPSTPVRGNDYPFDPFEPVPVPAPSPVVRASQGAKRPSPPRESEIDWEALGVDPEQQKEWLKQFEAAPVNDKLMDSNLAAIQGDIEKLKKVCGNVGFMYEPSLANQCFVVRMQLDTSFLSKHSARQWGVTAGKPIIIQLKFDWDYLDAPEIPHLLTFQSSDPRLNRTTLTDYETEYGVVQWFLETRITAVLRKNWLQRKKAKPAAKPAPAALVPKAEAAFSEASLHQIQNMGFTSGAALAALRSANGNTENAIRILLGEHVPSPAADQLPKDPRIKRLVDLGFTEQEAKQGLEIFGDVEAVVENMLDDVMARKGGSGNGIGKGGDKRAMEVTPDDYDIGGLKEEENLWVNKDRNSCLLANLFEYISLRFITCPSYCLICDKILDVALNKLPVCANQACRKVYETSSCGSNSVINEIKHSGVTVDFLITLLAAVVSGINVKGWNRGGMGLGQDPVNGANMANMGYGNPALQKVWNKRTTFEPFPYGLGFGMSANDQDSDLLLQTIDKIPAISEMQQYSSDEQLKAVLDEVSPLCFPLLRWILQSNRTYLSHVPPSKQIAEMGTPWQFQVVNSFPEHEEKFQRWRRKASNKTYKAFHGSPITNWHSIIRTGLRGGFVPGIYMAGMATTSYGYMGVGTTQSRGWNNSQFKCSNQLSCIGLLEVADMRHDQALITGGAGEQTINVAMDHSLVVTRFMFFYPTGPQWINNRVALPGRRGGHNGAALQGPIAQRIRTNDFQFLRSSLEDDEDQVRKGNGRKN